MPKKKELPKPDYEKVRSIDQVEKHILECQRTITRKYQLRIQAESARTDLTASYNEQIKHLKEELEHELGVLTAWDNRKKVLSARGATEDEEPAQEAPEEAALPPTPIPTPIHIPVPAAPLSPQLVTNGNGVTNGVPMPVLPPTMLPPPPPPMAPIGSLVPFPKKPVAA
jgi:hypothetical protein